MKIGFFTEGYYPQLTGVATTVDACARALERRGHEVYIIAPKVPGVKDEKRVIRIASIKHPRESEFRVATVFPGRSLLLASKVDFDIIHGHAGGPLTLLGWEVAKLKRVPFLVTYHTLWNSYMHYILKGKVIKPRMVEIASRIFGNLCDSLVVPTKKIKEELSSYGVEKPIHVIPNGINLDQFRGGDSKWLRKTLKIDSETKIVLYVGRLGKEKSVDYLIKAFKALHKELPQTALVIVGDGAEKHKLRELTRKLTIEKHVYFTGGVDQVFLRNVYAGADVFAFASRTETQGMVVLEAMAAGLPVITVDDPAYTDVIHEGVTGMLVKGSPTAFAKKLAVLLNDEELQRKLAAAALAKVGEYSIDHVAEQLEKLYKQLIAQNSRKIDFPFRHLSKYLLNAEK